MNPGLLIVAGLGGYVVYEKLSTSDSAASQPGVTQKAPFWNSWFQSGNQPQTGNGSPTTDAQSVSNAIAGVSKFATSLVSYFGTAGNKQAATGSGGIGASTTQTDVFGTSGFDSAISAGDTSAGDAFVW